MMECASRTPSFAMQDFRKIEAWRRAHVLSITIQKLARRFGRAGFSQLRAQLTKSADAIPSNIVAGCNGEANREFARFLSESIKAANNTEHHLLTAKDLRLISPDVWQKLTAETIEIRKMTYAYRRRVLEDIRYD